MFKKISTIFFQEKDNWALWLPVFFGAGISFYFSLSFEPNRYFSPAILAMCLSFAFVFRKSATIFWLIIVASILIAGFSVAQLRTNTVSAPVITKKLGVRKVEGTVVESQSRPHGSRFILELITIEHLPRKEIPVRIRVNINTDNGHAKAGDKISFLAVLSPPPIPAVPGGYDFARFAFFRQIGAVGYAVSDIKITEKAKGFSANNTISNLRKTIEKSILKILPNENGAIASALLVGERGNISKKTMDDIRTAGIAHILAISGLHLSLVAAIFFFLSRAAFALSPRLVLRYNIKKWAAYIAILGSLFYLLISGSPISAQRAFIMTSLILTAIIIDRTGKPMRSVALAAFIVLLATPESILTPSFQMSFAAVIALISGFEALQPMLNNHRDSGLLKRGLIYFFGMLASSIIAGVATAPFAIYHFNNFSTYGVLANLIAIPITSFIIMPSGVMSLVLMPLGLEKPALELMSWGIEIIRHSSGYIANLPQAVELLPPFPMSGLAFITIGFLWITLWTTKWRICGLIFITLGIAFILLAKTPDIIIDSDAKLFAVKGETGNMLVSSKIKAKYSRQAWQKKYGWDEAFNMEKANDKNIGCDDTGCIYKKNGYTIAISKRPKSLMEDCYSSDILINLTDISPPCRTSIYISKYDLKNKGTHEIYLRLPKPLVINSSEMRGNRPWRRRFIRSKYTATLY